MADINKSYTTTNDILTAYTEKVIEPTLNNINKTINTKQDKQDQALETTDKSIVGAINSLNAKFRYNFTQLYTPDKIVDFSISNVEITKIDGGFHMKGAIPRPPSSYIFSESKTQLIESHKYYLTLCNKPLLRNDFGSQWEVYRADNTKTWVNIEFSSIITGFVAADRVSFYSRKEPAGGLVDINITPMIIDLTEMFGAGNEPATVAEVQLYITPYKYYSFGKNVETDIFATKTEVNTIKQTKQDKLIAGSGIIIAEDGKTISASGGIEIVDELPPVDYNESMKIYAIEGKTQTRFFIRKYIASPNKTINNKNFKGDEEL